MAAIVNVIKNSPLTKRKFVETQIKHWEPIYDCLICYCKPKKDDDSEYIIHFSLRDGQIKNYNLSLITKVQKNDQSRTQIVIDDHRFVIISENAFQREPIYETLKRILRLSN